MTLDEAIIDAAMFIAREKGKPKHLMLNYGSYAALDKALGARREYVDWEKLKARVQAICHEKQIDLCGLKLEPIRQIPIRNRGGIVPGTSTSSSPSNLYSEYCKRQKITGLISEVGEALLTGTIS